MSDPDTLRSLVAPLVQGVRETQDAASGLIVRSLRAADRDIEHRLHELACETSARYVLGHLLTARPIRQRKHADGGRLELLEHALGLVMVDGFYAEFGVYKGDSLAFIANRIDSVIYGFDSFEGLPSDWFLDYGKGFFSLGGQAPRIETAQQNFRLLKGWFEDSLPVFTAQIDGPAAFLHIACDLYESARAALEGLASRIVPGTVIVLAEYLNYPGWERHEFRAFAEFCAAHGVRYRYAAFTPTAFAVTVVIEAVDPALGQWGANGGHE